MMNGPKKSDLAIVAEKPTNKAGKPAAEPVEPRARTEGNTHQQSTDRTQGRVRVSQALERVRQVAKARKKERFTALLHHISVDLLRQSFYALKRNAAPGVDGVRWSDYEANLESNLQGLHDRVHRGAYRALPSRRKYIPKPDGRQRPLGIASLEDKLLQRAVVAVLNAIYEEDFLGFSYGFRPKRSQHDALDALATGIQRRKVSWILDADYRSFFDTVSHEWLIRFLEHRIGDERILRLIRKWLKAGVLEAEVVTESEAGTPQGATVSPLLANVYLHYVFDLWVQQWRKRHARGDMIIVRYADDSVLGFEYEADAQRFLAEMGTRSKAFSLQLHPDKTRIIRFGRFAALNRKERGRGKPETFNFLGFTMICGQKRTGGFQLLRRTRRDRLQRTIQRVKEELQRRRHQPIPDQGKWLAQVVRGFYAYHAVPTNYPALRLFRVRIAQLWKRALSRRGQRGQLTWKQMPKLVDAWLPPPRILHPWPERRFAVKHPRWEPCA
ncbi:group II intron reverse transcriptase/maturase [Methylacidimicrobium sp. B4]|uniref:group II intron reverse transcriptase/maturase n=1 Tax=Methylacidimicrobium sp. B4 TaxID=2796139 RepID=UPI001A8CEEB6|nr:group II intron reverse transcriptase/maturase [Methylacidimicrobium sp. B4]QSR84694.1 group II intron reverse transcriptase/maturase [Methylacidimicrobium sp. B4]